MTPKQDFDTGKMPVGVVDGAQNPGLSFVHHVP